MRKQVTRSLFALFALAALATLPTDAQADSVAQIMTSVRISAATARLIDPQGRPGMMMAGTRTAARPGDVLTFIARFTPVPNGAVRGLGGYITVYVPRNTEVVGVRIIDSTEATIRPTRGGLASDGCGPRGCDGYGTDTSGAALLEGSLSQLYADTGVFYSTDPLVQRIPHGSGIDEFLTVFNGIEMTPRPTGIRNIGTILGTAGPYYSHNQWDWIQVMAFGNGAATAINTRGDGNTPDMYGSPVAGPLTWYPNEASYTGAITPGMETFDPTLVVASTTIGPWERIRTWGGEIGRRGNTPPVPDPGVPTRIGIEAFDAAGDPLGQLLHGGAPLVSYNTAAPTDPYTRALRYAVGELVVGIEYLAEFSLRVIDLPLDPVTMSDVICAEVFGGDASARDTTGGGGGKDHTWRYFIPASACVSLDLLFDLTVDKLVAVDGDMLTYTIELQNLATTAHTNVEIHHCYDAGDLAHLASIPASTTGAAGCPAGTTDRSWTIATLMPGDTATYSIDMRITGATRNTVLARAFFTSDQLPSGFSTVAFTNVDASLVLIDIGMTATPDLVPTAPGTITYLATITNGGPGTAGAIEIIATLPAPFTYTAGTTVVNGTAMAGTDPTIVVDPGTGDQLLHFLAGPFSLPDLSPAGMAGDSMTLEFGADVPASTPAGAYAAGLETWFAASRDVSDVRFGLAEVIVGTVRSDTPVVTSTVADGVTTLRGTTTEADGTIIRVFINGVEVARGTASGGTWTVTIPALSANERVSVSAEAPGELESLRSAEITVPGTGTGGTAECSDGIDNDGDGLIDLADPDCTSASDPSETHIPECADGVDNDGDSLIDYGADPGCRSLVDDDESGPAECNDGIDNDGNGTMDFPDDPGCSSADDVLELDVPACADGIDNDGDGLIDYPLDPGCTSAIDDDETAAIPVPDAGPTPDAGPPGDGAAPGFDSGAGMPEDLGGVDAPGGCSCRAARRGGSRGGLGLLGLALVGLAFLRRRTISGRR